MLKLLKKLPIESTDECYSKALEVFYKLEQLPLEKEKTQEVLYGKNNIRTKITI